VKSGKIFQSNQIVDQSKDGRFFSFKTVIFPVVYGNRTFYVQILEEQLPEAIPANLQQLFADVSTR